ncbi:alpha/beta hydrolase [Ktedonosporobacter rubrisoli]|uniref:Alpha/beta hydrolase n=1 Tax=Ktedonosporobacter rubrisoli TaxID=2509675 RepID=A0A4V0Z0F8_KTERU|nr:alpha/beta hydrolase [Ktedonosporobacter rubrisoli]QBD83071.1 alpha/beta hydrolase [Ktedonosporobacter rubrisoli]
MQAADTGFIHRYIPAHDNKQRVLLLLHGTGGDEDDLLELGRALAPGAGLLSPRGKVLEHGAPRFFRRLAQGVFDIEDLTYRTHELVDFINIAAQAYHFELDKLTIVGYSNGANIAASLLLLHPKLLRSAILFRAMKPFDPGTMPDLSGTSIYLAAGKLDPLIPAADTQQLIELLQSAGAHIDAHWQGTGHALNVAEIEGARTWLSKLPTSPTQV